MKTKLAVLIWMMAPMLGAQSIDWSRMDKLKAKASNIVDLNLGKDMLGLGAGLLGAAGDGDKDAARVKRVVSGLNGITIKSFEFEKKGQYDQADVDSLIQQMGGPGWNLIISATEKKNGQTTRIWTKPTDKGELGGLRILAAEPKELTVVEITGKVNLADLKDIPGVRDVVIDHSASPEKKKQWSDDEDHAQSVNE